MQRVLVVPWSMAATYFGMTTSEHFLPRSQQGPKGFVAWWLAG
jgi:hypothetical protein